jgi:hypothetical protein
MIHYETTADVFISRDCFPWLSPYILSEDSYLRPYVVELPLEVAKRITFEGQSPT